MNETEPRPDEASTEGKGPVETRRARFRIALAFFSVAAGVSCAVVARAPAVFGIPKDDPSATLSAVWIGHSTVLIRMGDQRVLTDPNLGGDLYVVPRDTPASVRSHELPFAHVLLASHMHFDHFHRPTLKELSANSALFYPVGGEPWAGSLPQRRRRALAAWEEARVGKLTITAVPVIHFGGRYGIDSLWNDAFTGYIVDGAGKRVFFAGDTGLDQAVFEEIGERFPGIDLALIPIAPYRAGRKGHRFHANPAEALEIFRAVKARYMIPIHFEAYYGFWNGYDTPRRDLEVALEKTGLGDRVFALFPGERWIMPDEESERPLVTREPRRARPFERSVSR